MALRIHTVWVTCRPHDTPLFESFPPPGKETGREVLYLTNNRMEFDSLFEGEQRCSIDVLDLYPYAFPLKPVSSLGELFSTLLPEDDSPASAEKLWRVWEKLEKRLDILPLWALKGIALMLKLKGERALTLCFNRLIQEGERQGHREYPWLESFPRLPNREAPKSLPTHEDCSPVDIEEAVAPLLPGGALARSVPDYEVRPGQIKMVRAVMEAFNTAKHLLVEAGTGVGKSMGYLLPAAAWAGLNDIPVVISTNTRNLQTQLVEKDIPRILSIFNTHPGNLQRPLQAALLKGRSNYLCLRQFDNLMTQAEVELDTPEFRTFSIAIAWAAQTRDGDLDLFSSTSRCDSSFLSRLSSTGEECQGRGCRFYRHCFLQKARIAAASAHLIVVNHALALAEARTAGGILPPYAQIVFDEAHNLEEIATSYFSRELSLGHLNRTLRSLTRKRSDGKEGGVLGLLRRHLKRGDAVSDPEIKSKLGKLITQAHKESSRVRVTFRSLLERMLDLLPPDQEVVRFRGSAVAPDLKSVEELIETDEPSPRISRTICRRHAFIPVPESWPEEDAAREKQRAHDAMGQLIASLLQIVDLLRASQDSDELGLYNDLPLSVESVLGQIKELSDDLDFIWEAGNTDYVFWVERESGKGNFAGLSRLTAAPLSVGEELDKALYSQKRSVIFSSATLRVGSSFAYIKNRLGINLIPQEQLLTCVAETPFNYSRQCTTLALTFLPEPRSGRDSLAYTDPLSSLLLDILGKTGGRTLVLFTSYQMMKQVARQVQEPLEKEGIRLLVHGEDGTRDQITRIFRVNSATALFGTQSFWEGVDIAGEALSCVVIAKLPFASLGDPIFEARCDQIDESGGSSFPSYSLPHAVIRFRQGFGRLIRTQSDRGTVIITDPRLMTKNYGGTFRKSLPSSVLKVESRSALLERLDADFSTPGDPVE